MLPLMGSLMSGASSLIGSIYSANTSAKMNEENVAMQRETNQMNIDQNQKNRDFQQQMSNTAYQRSSEDMKAAGLNPMMMFGSGGPSSTPSGGTPNIQAPHLDPHAGTAQLGRAVGDAVSSAVQAKTLDKMTEEIANLQVERARSAASTGLIEAEKGLVGQKQSSEVEYTRGAGLENTLRESRIPEATFNSAKFANLGSLPEWAKSAVWRTEFGGDTVAKLFNSAVGVGRLMPGKAGSKFSDFYHERTGF